MSILRKFTELEAYIESNIDGIRISLFKFNKIKMQQNIL